MHFLVSGKFSVESRIKSKRGYRKSDEKMFDKEKFRKILENCLPIFANEIQKKISKKNFKIKNYKKKFLKNFGTQKNV